MAEPGFWDNQEKAQATVAELKALNAIAQAARRGDRRRPPISTALIEMADEDESLAAEVAARARPARRTASTSWSSRGCSTARSTPRARSSRSTPATAAPTPTIGPRCCCGCTSTGRRRTATTSSCSIARTTSRPASTAPRSPIRGPMAYGYLKGETGMHRLVRISPFNAEGKRQTSFAAVDVSPEISDTVEIELRDEDIREDVFRASGAGGQHVNKTSSAIRLTHLPTGIVVQCQNERSQHKNRATAIKMLRARLARLEEEKREAEQAAKYQEKAKTGFGSQIRNYFLHPDQRVKDARTGYYVGNFQSVLDGNIQGFLDAYLRWRVA